MSTPLKVRIRFEDMKSVSIVLFERRKIDKEFSSIAFVVIPTLLFPFTRVQLN